MAVIDLQGFVAELKDHAVGHGFHLHDARHFIETYTNRQNWEVDLHPENACGGPLDMLLSLEVDPRALLAFEDELIKVGEDGEPSRDICLTLAISFLLPPLPHAPDLLILATEIAAVGSTDLPLEVSANDGFASVTDAPKRTVNFTARFDVAIADAYFGNDVLCDELERCAEVAEYLLDRAPAWIEGS